MRNLTPQEVVTRAALKAAGLSDLVANDLIRKAAQSGGPDADEITRKVVKPDVNKLASVEVQKQRQQRLQEQQAADEVTLKAAFGPNLAQVRELLKHAAELQDAVENHPDGQIRLGARKLFERDIAEIQKLVGAPAPEPLTVKAYGGLPPGFSEMVQAAVTKSVSSLVERIDQLSRRAGEMPRHSRG